MKVCKVPPGDAPAADAFNLTYCAWVASFRPEAAEAAQRMAKTITAKVTDWEEVAAYLAIIAANFVNFADRAMPEANADGVPYPRPSEKFRLMIETDNLVPA